jgi:hypothetical protein
MRGVIFQELKELVRVKLGGQAWTTLLSEAGVETTIYSAMGSYPDTELARLLAAFSNRLGRPIQDVLEDLGQFMVVRFYKFRPYLFDPKWDFLDAVEHIGDLVKQVASVQQPLPDEDVEQVVFSHKRDAPTRVTTLYSSPRMYCHLWKGCMKGFAQHFEVDIAITEPFCMLQGDDHCEIIVDLLGPIAKKTEESVRSQ